MQKVSYSQTYELPFLEDIPNSCFEFKKEKNSLKKFIKFLKRYAYIFFNGQLKYEKKAITDGHKNILWINVSAPSIGDSLMDLSSRTFLSNKKVDLLTDEKNELIYANDKIFENVYTTSNLNIHKNYDLVILDSYSSRTMSLKKKYAKKIPYVSIYGYFNGPEVNRILFSFFKMKMLLGLSFDSEKINKIAGPVIYIKNHKSHTKVESNAVSICIGGEWEYRTYKKWNKIIKKIIDSYDVPIYMVGSNNGMDLAVQIESELKCPRLHNHVGKETLIETANIIEKTSIFIGCDGGLLHVANGLGKIVLPLFARVDPSLRLTNKMQSFTLFDNQDVNNILVEDVVKNFERAFKLYQNHLQS